MTLTELFNERSFQPRLPVTISANGGPVDVATLDLDTGRYERVSPLTDEKAANRAFVLLRSGGWPVGVEELDLVDGFPSGAISSQLDHEVLTSKSRSAKNTRPISVVVCTRNRPELLATCLARIVPLLREGDELIVVDNAPKDGRTAAVVADYGTGVRRVVEPWPGLANARNCGLQSVSNDFVVFTDDDVSPDAAWLDVIKATFASHPGAVCVSGSVLPQSLNTAAQRHFQEFGGYGGDFREVELHLSLDPAPSPIFPFHPRLLGTGANMAFRTEALRAIGGFDPALGAGTPACGGEDIDIAVRILLKGLLLVRQPAAVVWHPSHESNADLVAQIESYGCGLAAAMSKFATQRSTAARLLRRVPAGLRALLASDSVKNDKRSSTYPSQLRWAELRGIVRGPFAYRASVRRHRLRARRSA